MPHPGCDQHDRLLAIGSYTAVTGGHGAGISIVSVDRHGHLGLVSQVTSESPSYLLWQARTRTLYAANETAEGSLSAYRLRRGPASTAAGADRRPSAAPAVSLVPLGSQPSAGGRPCHLALHPSGRWLVSSNYAGGTFTVIATKPEGSLGGVTSLIEHQGRGIHPTRQDRPHPHTVLFTPDGQWALLLDVALDSISVHRFDQGAMATEPKCVVSCAPGSGPRHAIWLSPDRIAVVEEISGTVSTFAWHNDGALEGPIDTVPSTSSGDSDAWPSEIQLVSQSEKVAGAAGMRATGRTAVIVANRTQGLLTELLPSDMDAAGPVTQPPLSPIRDLRLPSNNARHFWADDSTAYIALQDSDRLIALDLETGRIRAELGIISPAFVVPLEEAKR